MSITTDAVNQLPLIKTKYIFVINRVHATHILMGNTRIEYKKKTLDRKKERKRKYCM